MLIQPHVVPGHYYKEVWVHGTLPDPDRYLLSYAVINKHELDRHFNRWLRQFGRRLTLDHTVRST